ncbi:MAG: molybdopterin-dependent oxidoreductase [Myxococcota bacterium]|nr:molybdopterin-dependent oxidoreductase [Myxococcota bacterium]
MSETRHTFCRICESLCGLEVDVEEGRVVAIRPDREHVATGGFACAKGLKQHELFESPDRVRHPLRREGDTFHRVSWEQALREIGGKVAQLRGDHGADSIAMYVGTAAGFSLLHPIFAQGFMTGLGSRSIYASATQDCSNKFAVAREVYGFPFTQPFPDVDRVGCLIVVGANPVVSKWSFLQVPNPIDRLRAIEARGGRLYVVDPRRTETAKVAGHYVPIRPGTDVFFYLAFLHELIAQGGVDRAVVAAHTSGFGEIEALVRDWTPERAEAVTRMPAATLRRMVADYREADGACLYSSTGVNMGGRGALAFWLQEVINAVSGNLDRAGGSLVGRGVIDFPKLGRRSGFGLSRERSRIGGFSQVNDAFPGAVLADEILTPGQRQVRALFCTGGNPLITMANSARLREAFEQLELLVAIDILPTETAHLAHYVLPATTPIERFDLPFAFPLLMGMQSRPYLQATRPVVRPEGEPRDEATIYLDLARACGTPLFGSGVAQRILEWSRDLHSRRHPEAQPSLPQERLMSLLLRLTGNGSFARLEREPHGRRLADHQPGSFLGARVSHEDGRIALAPAVLLERARTLDADYAAEREGADRLKLITRRHVKTHNSWTHNHPDFVSGTRHTNHLYMHPDDAASRGLGDGDLADVSSATATVRIPVSLLPDLQPGTCAMPHGWGHQVAPGLGVASKTGGVNVNLLAADGPEAVEPVSGMAHLTGIYVEVRPAAGPRDTGSWSGLPASPLS